MLFAHSLKRDHCLGVRDFSNNAFQPFFWNTYKLLNLKRKFHCGWSITKRLAEVDKAFEWLEFKAISGGHQPFRVLHHFKIFCNNTNHLGSHEYSTLTHDPCNLSLTKWQPFRMSDNRSSPSHQGPLYLWLIDYRHFTPWHQQSHFKSSLLMDCRRMNCCSEAQVWSESHLKLI